MTTTIFDIENTVYLRHDAKKSKDLSPFHPHNRLVSIGWGFVEGTLYRPGGFRFFHHKKLSPPQAENHAEFQRVLDQTTLLVAHNIKHDLQWIEESGFTYDGPIYCTQVGEYLLLRGNKDRFLALDAVAEFRGCTRKLKDKIQYYYDNDILMDEVPPEIVEEYNIGDCQTTGEIFISQQADYASDKFRGLVPVRDMSMEFTRCLVDMEKAGIAIDTQAIAEVKSSYLTEKMAIETRLREIVQEVMGDRPINLASPEQLSMVVYSRKVKDKKTWASVFNIGTDFRGKPLRRPRMKPGEFAHAVRSNTDILKKQSAFQCHDCKGKGTFYKIKKNGELYAGPSNCKTCMKTGLVYVDLPAFAGLKMTPRGPEDVAQGGFSTDGGTLERLAGIAKASGNATAAEFLEGAVRLNAIDSYLNSFIGGIERGLLPNNILHPQLNQTITATGRLSSSEPNFQNLPRAGTTPLRKVVVSRFESGEIIEADYAGLEFVVAGELSGDEEIFRMKREGIDAHKKTATIIFEIDYGYVTKDQRQFVKPDTFAPLYGAMGMDKPAHIRRYYENFTKVYAGVGRWHKELQEQAIRDKIIRLPTGREFYFPHAKRTATGGSTQATMIKNYPVQAMATADIVPLGIIRLRKLFRQHGLKSLIFLTVHDSVVVDRHPEDSRDLIVKLLIEALTGVPEDLLQRYGYVMKMPLDIEVMAGKNWMEKEVIH
jgi:DNA polymerase I-like protein with 3'-5' exonuclease and polymerase domains